MKSKSLIIFIPHIGAASINVLDLINYNSKHIISICNYFREILYWNTSGVSEIPVADVSELSVRTIYI